MPAAQVADHAPRGIVPGRPGDSAGEAPRIAVGDGWVLSPLLQPVSSNVRVGMTLGPFVQTRGQTRRESAAPREGRLPHEYHGRAGLVTAQASRQQGGVVGDVLGRDDATLRDRACEDLVVRSACQAGVGGGYGIVTALGQLLGRAPGEHLVQ